MAEYIDNQVQGTEESPSIDYRKLWSMVVMNWYWFIFSAFFFVAIGYTYLRYQHPVYRVSSKVLIKDDNPRAYNQSMAMEQFGMITNTNGFDNEIEILSSTSVATRAVKALKLYTTYIVDGRFNDSQIYKTSPILVDMDEARLDELALPVTIEFTRIDGGAHAHVVVPLGGVETEVLERDLTTFPTTIQTRVGELILSQNAGYELTDRKLTAIITPPVLMGRRYSGALMVAPTSKMTTVAELSLQDIIVERAMDYLTQVVIAYNEDANEDKNEVALKTEEFIKERIDVIRNELDETEQSIEGFKRRNDLINLPTDASQALSQTTELQKRQVEIQTQMSLVNSLIDYTRNPANTYTIIPANIGITNASTNKMLEEYNTLVLNRNRLLRSSSEDSPVVKQMTERIMAMWEAIKQHLGAIYSDLQIQKKSVDQQYALFSGKVNSTPTQERAMNNMGRQQEIKAGIYLMLLQKREENYISQASNATKARVIDQPQFRGKVSPRSPLIMLGALVIGLLLPMVLLYLNDLLHYRLNGREDLTRRSKLSVLGDIPLAFELKKHPDQCIVVHENSNDIMEESFRTLRTNLRFVLEGDEKVIAVTSCVPSEGKTFIGSNLAMSIALLGKRVLLVGLDIRKPRLVRLFKLPPTEQGLTSYLSAGKADFALLDKQIIHGVMNEHLDVLPAGVIPPNPAELISRQILDEAFVHLRENYDYIIVDTPPVGLVSDTYELGRLFDATFFVVRADVTVKSDIDVVNDVSESRRLPKVNFVLNGVDLTKRRYGFYYGYGKYSSYSRYGTYYGRYGHYGSYGHYGDHSKHIEK